MPGYPGGPGGPGGPMMPTAPRAPRLALTATSASCSAGRESRGRGSPRGWSCPRAPSASSCVCPLPPPALSFLGGPQRAIPGSVLPPKGAPSDQIQVPHLATSSPPRPRCAGHWDRGPGAQAPFRRKPRGYLAQPSLPSGPAAPSLFQTSPCGRAHTCPSGLPGPGPQPRATHRHALSPGLAWHTAVSSQSSRPGQPGVALHAGGARIPAGAGVAGFSTHSWLWGGGVGAEPG